MRPYLRIYPELIPTLINRALVLVTWFNNILSYCFQCNSKSWQVVGELVQLVQLSVTATALALYYLIYCYMQLVYYTLRSALYFHNADGWVLFTKNSNIHTHIVWFAGESLWTPNYSVKKLLVPDFYWLHLNHYATSSAFLVSVHDNINFKKKLFTHTLTLL